MRLHWELAQHDAASPLAMEGLAVALIAGTWCRPQSLPLQPSPCIAESERYMRDHFDQPVGLSEVARAVKVHPGYLARVFQAHHKCSVGEYLRRIRLDWAATKLAEGELPIAEIATAAGFYDQAHFSNLFRRHTGVAPGAFRSQTIDRRRVC
jgi:AraC family transcriptional regulator